MFLIFQNRHIGPKYSFALQQLPNNCGKRGHYESINHILIARPLQLCTGIQEISTRPPEHKSADPMLLLPSDTL